MRREPRSCSSWTGRVPILLSSGDKQRSRRAVRRIVAEHGVEDVDSAASEAENGLVVALALSPLTVVVGPRWCMSEAGEGGQEQRVLEPMVPEAAGHVRVDGRARFPGRGPQARIGRQMAWCAEAADRADLNGNACPEARDRSPADSAGSPPRAGRKNRARSPSPRCRGEPGPRPAPPCRARRPDDQAYRLRSPRKKVTGYER